MNHPLATRRRFNFVLGAFGASIGCCARAQQPRQYATMSLVGDMLTAVERGEQTGSHLDRNRITELKTGSDILDRAALGTINDLIVKADPAAKPVSLLVDEPALYEQQSKLFDGKFVRLPVSLSKAAKDGGATHMLLVTKDRAGLSFKFDVGGRVGQGSASGLGFYVESQLRTRDMDNNRRTEGFLGLFVHLRVTVMDLATEGIVAERAVVSTEPFLNTREGFGGLPWDALSPQQKVQAVSELLLRALRDNVPPLLRA